MRIKMLVGNCEVIYGAQQLTGKILSRLDLRSQRAGPQSPTYYLTCFCVLLFCEFLRKGRCHNALWISLQVRGPQGLAGSEKSLSYSIQCISLAQALEKQRSRNARFPV